MDGDIIAQMRKEEADLSRKLKAVRDFLAAYNVPASNEAAPAPATAAGPNAAAKAGSAQREKVNIDGFTAYGRGVVATAMQLMLTQAGPVKTRQAVEFMQGLGMELTGQDPVNAVGALLYRSADLVSHGKKGWTIADEAVAREIVGKYAHKENEAPSETADASDAASEGGPTPAPAWTNPFNIRAG